MALKCYTKTNKSGGKYTTCNKDAQEKNVSDNKMPPKKTPSGNTPNSEKSQEWHDSNRFWKAAQLRLIPGIRELIPKELTAAVFGHDTKKTGKQQRQDFLRIRAFKQLKSFSDDSTDAKLKKMVGDLSKSYDTYISRRKAATKAMKGGPPVAPTMKKEDETRPASRAKGPAAKKVAVSYRVGSGPMKKSTATVNKTGPRTGTVGTVVKTRKAPTRARARKATAPVKNAKTAPQKIKRFDLVSGRTGNEFYEGIGSTLGIPKYGNKVTPGKTFLKRNR
tara:strand:+ start:6045 stop:6875 length:831 start_codon:yes stop_codon:yes gene_type:complete